MPTASVARVLGAATISADPATSETKNAHWCETPRSRGFWRSMNSDALALASATRWAVASRASPTRWEATSRASVTRWVAASLGLGDALLRQPSPYSDRPSSCEPNESAEPVVKMVTPRRGATTSSVATEEGKHQR